MFATSQTTTRYGSLYESSSDEEVDTDDASMSSGDTTSTATTEAVTDSTESVVNNESDINNESDNNESDINNNINDSMESIEPLDMAMDNNMVSGASGGVNLHENIQPEDKENIPPEDNIDNTGEGCPYCERRTCCMIEFQSDFGINCAKLRAVYNGQVERDISIGLSAPERFRKKRHYIVRCRKWLCCRMNHLVPEGFPFRQRLSLRDCPSNMNWMLEFPVCIQSAILEEFQAVEELTESEEECEDDFGTQETNENLGAPLPNFTHAGRQAFTRFLRSEEGQSSYLLSD